MTTSPIDNDDIVSEKLTSEIWNAPVTAVIGFAIICLWAFFQLIGMLVGAIGTPAMDALQSAVLSGNEDDMMQIITQGDILWMSAFFSSIGGVIVVCIFIWMKRGLSIKEYLNLHNPDWKCWLKWVGIFVLFSIVLEAIAQNFEELQTDFMTDVLKNTGNLPMLALTVGVLGPIFEEVFFRGFLFKSWEKSIGGHATVLITSSIFAFMHYGQYELGVVLLIIPMGMILGYARLYTGSLFVPIVLHVANNVLATYMGLEQLKEVAPAMVF